IVDFAASTLVHEDTITKKDLDNKSDDEIKDYLVARPQDEFEEKSHQLNGQEQLLEFEKVVILRVVDTIWTDHIDAMDQLRQSVGLRAFGQNNPLVENQTEGYSMYN
ncbi:preprotein translocase subunit SecA, partial [Enterococcus faecalis]